MAVSFSDLQLAFEFVNSGGMGENEAYLDRQSGKIYWHSEFGDNDEELPDDIDHKKYIQSRTRESSISASLWSWISLVSSYLTTTRKFAKSSAEEVLTADIRSCWCGEVARIRAKIPPTLTPLAYRHSDLGAGTHDPPGKRLRRSPAIGLK